MRYAILGGSFNPVHIGHLFLADAALVSFGYDRVILIPAFQSPLKESTEGASPQERMEMLAASIPGDPRLTIDDCELKREGVSYTIDTLKDIIARYEPKGKPGLILGDDLAATFHKWHDPEEIAALSDIIIARRLPNITKTDSASPVSAGETAEPVFETEAIDFPYPYRKLDNEIINVASKQIREKIGKGEAWRYLVPSGARYIIEDRGLYGFRSFLCGENSQNGENGSGSQHAARSPGEENLLQTIVEIENVVRAELDFSKFLHSRNTALLSRDLCRRFGLDCQKGYLAGIAHDMCKPLGDRELMRLAHADGGSFSKLEHEKPGLLHGRAAAVLLQRKYGVGDKDILEAIRYHTTGVQEMSALAKVVYIADKIEISRERVDPALRKMSEESDLNTLFVAVLSNTVTYLKSRQMNISYGTRRMLAAMRKRNKP